MHRHVRARASVYACVRAHSWGTEGAKDDLAGLWYGMRPAACRLSHSISYSMAYSMAYSMVCGR